MNELQRATAATTRTAPEFALHTAKPRPPRGRFCSGASKTDSHQKRMVAQLGYVGDRRDRGEVVVCGYPDPQPRIGRNDPCPCGSGKKFKKCCYGVTNG